ncbi:ABC transporter ATP-binding protein [Infirmifilum sp. NZ]|uniref:ABC transporter ATP-binding protein n=1 Tax=Infirmifilum sp. NZ TaxID=2926850 RepID=UPI0027A72AF3|nr:ABC transporter ATP-binding protein [Infirmifilum sp. NZ]UNQ73534.1 ABC transporter ATP-binding protein [Infirmifilum sp. NZ]
MSGNPLLSIEGLRVYFYTYAGVARAVDGVDLRLYEGESFALVGETGCGKSTVARAIMGLIPPPGRVVSGRIVLDGVDILSLSEEELRKIRGSKVAYIAQDPMSALDPLFTIGAHVAETIVSHNSAKWAEAWIKALKILSSVAIPEPERRARSYPHELSGGLKQRSVIATAIANNPKLLIADEPTTALDVTIQTQVMDLVMDLKKRYRSTLLLIAHNLGLVAEYTERVAVMYLGKIVEVADVEDLFEKPLHPYTQGLLKSVPNPLRNIEKLYSIPGSVPSAVNPPQGCRFHPRCPFATDKCRVEEPPLVEAEKEHLVACWLYSKG